MWEVNRLNNPKFYTDTTGFVVDEPGQLDFSTAIKGCFPVHFNVKNLTSDINAGIQNELLLVHPGEIYSASIYCRTSDYTLYDGNDPQVKLTLLGLSDENTAPVVLGTDLLSKIDFPAQDWFRLKIENIAIPAGIHYLVLRASISRNGSTWFYYPCIEFGENVTEFEPYTSNIAEYYTPDVYEGITDTDEIIKTQNATFDELSSVTEKIQSRFYILTCDEEGIAYYEQQLSIIANPFSETLEFRRRRVLTRFSNIVPYTFPFLQQYMDDTVGKDNWDAWLDFNSYTLYVETQASENTQITEVHINVNNIKPCNIVFVSVPNLKNTLALNEKVQSATSTRNYKLNSTWKLGQKPFRTLGNLETVKETTMASITPGLLQKIAQFTADTVNKVIINNTITIMNFERKSASDGTATIQYSIPSSQTNLITDIKLYDVYNTLLSHSVVYCPVIDHVLLQHTIPTQEVI